MYEVTVKIGGNASKYWASLEFDDALAAAWSNGWVNTWQQHSWKNAKGNTIRNAEQWQQLYELMTPHGRRFVCQKA